MAIAEQLQDAFRDVVVIADGALPIVRARQHFRGPPREGCPHAQQRTARNVTAGLRVVGGHQYASGDPKWGSFRFAYLRTCCRCDAITGSELAA